jgi:hypothetical protein
MRSSEVSVKLLPQTMQPNNKSSLEHDNSPIEPMNQRIHRSRRARRLHNLTRGLALFLLGGTCAMAQTPTTIYFESFSGSTENLHGTTPETTSAFAGGTLGATWRAGGNLNGNGIVVDDLGGTGNNVAAGTALLPFVPQQGYLYTLSANIYGDSGTVNRWLGLGFVQGVNSTWNVNPEASTSAWTSAGFNPTFWSISIKGSTSASTDNSFTGPGANNLAVDGVAMLSDSGNPSPFPSKSADSLKITLDTSNAEWHVAWHFDDVLVRSTAFSSVFAGTNAINYVGFSSAGRVDIVGITIDNFTLTAIEVPEPSAYALAGFGLLAVLTLRRRWS